MQLDRPCSPATWRERRHPLLRSPPETILQAQRSQLRPPVVSLAGALPRAPPPAPIILRSTSSCKPTGSSGKPISPNSDQDLQAGDLKAAQQDFNTLTALGQTGPNKNGQTFQLASRAQNFQAIGQALQSGDLAGAQSAFANLASTFGNQGQPTQTAISAYNSNSVAPEIVINLGAASNTSAANGSTNTSTTPELVINVGQGNGSSSASSSPEEVTINLGSGSSGAQITIDENQGQNGSNAEQVTINLNQAKNYELILNLINPATASQTQSNASNSLSVSA